VSPNACPSCGGTCCRDTTSGTRVEHMGAAQYVHDCEACTGGTKHGAALLSALRERDAAWRLLGQENRKHLEARAAIHELVKQIAVANGQRDEAKKRARLSDKHAKGVRKQVQDAVKSERASVVAWLQREAEISTQEAPETAGSFLLAADRIERGEHRDEGDR
jgi:hypothetical protein